MFWKSLLRRLWPLGSPSAPVPREEVDPEDGIISAKEVISDLELALIAEAAEQLPGLDKEQSGSEPATETESQVEHRKILSLKDKGRKQSSTSEPAQSPAVHQDDQNSSQNAQNDVKSNADIWVRKNHRESIFQEHKKTAEILFLKPAPRYRNRAPAIQVLVKRSHTEASAPDTNTVVSPQPLPSGASSSVLPDVVPAKLEEEQTAPAASGPVADLKEPELGYASIGRPEEEKKPVFCSEAEAAEECGMHSSLPKLDVTDDEPDWSRDFDLFVEDPDVYMAEAEDRDVASWDKSLLIDPAPTANLQADYDTQCFFDLDELYDEQDAQEPEPNVTRVSRADRALQKAIVLIDWAGWAHHHLPLVQQIFEQSGWGAARLALEREINRGMTPEELILAAHLKADWANNDYYWIAYERTGSSRLSQYVLSWPTALQVVRSFESLPQLEELERFVEQLYEQWYETPVLRRAFRAFNRFLWYRTANLQGCLSASTNFDFSGLEHFPVEEYSDLGLDDPLNIEQQKQLRELGVPDLQDHLKPLYEFQTNVLA